MSDPITQAGAVKGQSGYAAVTMGARQFTGMVTNRAAYRDGMVAYLTSKFYAGSRNDTIWDGINREISNKLTDVRSPGSFVYNTQTFPGCRSFYPWKYIQDGTEILRVMYDGVDQKIYDATGPSTKINIWNNAPDSIPTRFLGVNTELFFNNGIEQKKILESALTWEANTLFDGALTSDRPLGDFVIDPNGNVQQNVGGFNLLIAEDITNGLNLPAVQIVDDVLTLTLDISQLPDPTGTPTGIAATAGGTLTAGTHFIRIAGVDPNGNVTQAGNESAAVTTTGSASEIVWSWEPIAGAVSYRIYVSKITGGAVTYFTSDVNSFTQQIDVSTVSGTPPSDNQTSVEVPDNLFQMVGVQLALSNFVNATFLNGQTITIASVINGGMYSNQITAAFTHADYLSVNDTGTATSGTGITGGSTPSWETTLWAVTQDGGAQWINRGPQIQNWGIATPATAPTISVTPPPQVYPTWQPNTVYWRSGFIYTNIAGTNYLFQITKSGITDTVVPTWDTTTPGVSTTTDGSVTWLFWGTGVWASGTAYTKGSYVLGRGATFNSVFQSQNPGTSGTNQDNWTNATAGLLTPDNDIEWKCLGYFARYEGAGWPFSPTRSVSADTTIQDSNGFLQQVQDAPQNGGGEGATAVATIAQTPLPAGIWYVQTIAITNGGKGYTQGCVEIIVDNPATMPGDRAQATATVVNGVITSITLVQHGEGYSSVPNITIRGGANPSISGAAAPDWATTSGLPTPETISSSLSGGMIRATGPAFATPALGPPFIAVADGPNTFFANQVVTVSGFTTLSALNGTFPILSTYLGTGFDPGDPSIETLYLVNLSPIAHATEAGTATVTQNGMWLNIGAYAPVGTSPTFYVYAFGNSVTGHVSTASAQSAKFTAVANFYTVVQGFGSADPQVDTIWIFRPAQGESTPILVDKIANPGGGIPWRYVDQVPDISVNGGPELIAQIAAPTDHANDPPPANMTAPEYHLQRIWAISGNKVVYSGNSNQAVGAGNESFPPANEFPFVAQPIRLVPITVQNGGMLVFTTSGIYIILGTGDGTGGTVPFYDTLYYGAVNLLSYNALDVYNTQIFLMESNRKVSMIAAEYPFNPQGGYVEVGQPIGDQFKKVTTGGINTTLYDPATTYVSWNIQDTDETGMYVSDGRVGWFRMSVISPPESGLLWSPRRAIVGGTSAVQSVETTPGNHQLLIGPPTATPGPILARDATGTVYTDRTQPYPSWDAKGVNLLCTTGQWAEVAHISAKSTAVGARPTVSVLLNEIRPSPDRPYQVMELDDMHNDPPETPESLSAYSDRYVLLEGSGQGTTGDCLLTKFDYGAQNVGDELLDWGIFASVHDEREAGAER